MNPNTATEHEVPDLSNLTKTELAALVSAHIKEHGPPMPSYDGEKNTLFGWTDDGNGVWVLPASKANIDRFEDVARSHPGLGQCELMRLADAEFFTDWRDSDRAREAKSQEAKSTEAGDGAVPS